MNRIRTKIVLSLLVITLLPVYPVYVLLKNLHEKSRGIGFNKKVESALEDAVNISRELYAEYKKQTLTAAKEFAASDWVEKLLNKQDGVAASISNKAEELGTGKIDIFDQHGNLQYTGSNVLDAEFPQLYLNIVKPLTQKREPELLRLGDDRSHVSAFAPVIRNDAIKGFVVATKAIDQEFVRGSDQIVEVNQIFKTLDFLNLTEGFVLSFFVVYASLSAISVAVGYVFSRKITHPLIKLVEGTKKVAAGDWSHRVRVSSKDEVGELVRAFNQMVATLKEKQDQVIALEKMVVWREIARILAHEIKNPLTPIQLTVQQMKDKYSGDDPEYQKLLEECSEIVNDEVESLRTLVREFSEFARMPTLNLARANVNELINEVSKLYSDRRLHTELDASLPEFEFDHEKMRRVLINLIENAFDSMKEKSDGQVNVKTRRQDEKVLLEVSDTGSGIPDDLKQKIFEPYVSTKKSGVGLGLAIVKRVVEEHGGKISVASREGKGTTFHIELPIG
ncbi:HAMP domain-containing protein [candidate division KSB1 bacterium]|nr:HAMP domain-containing protein [candidate division KSB1 bacterium]NIR73138.1 HAMP domain-containing protein [candidate division KSB1 bacterium]NIS23841.1 HAMP domain-containing protein [candidate division KSB1 bacterium]NIT70762.1 HAMP domain-containing protein [candidate division KSB1 bacterium]NIU24490.1 HAMP domain-containing protein [candidate division KSB1 bacterium]